MRELIIAPDAPSAAGPYSPGLAVGDRIFLSGQGGFDPDTGELVSDTIGDQTTRAFRNVEALPRAAGASLDDVVLTSAQPMRLCTQTPAPITERVRHSSNRRAKSRRYGRQVRPSAAARAVF